MRRRKRACGGASKLIANEPQAGAVSFRPNLLMEL
jgi:hypothetical protein